MHQVMIEPILTLKASDTYSFSRPLASNTDAKDTP